MGTPIAPLDDIAKQGAAALELANDYTDFIEAARRRKKTTPAAEIQQNLFPPRIVRIQGAQLAGGLLPTYEVGGDWFDFVDNRDGAWLAIADTAGTGPTAAGLGAAALGALRAARRSGDDLGEALPSMDETVRQLGNPDFYVSAIVARWRAATQTLTWVNCGHAPAVPRRRRGRAASSSKARPTRRWGRGGTDPTFVTTERRAARRRARHPRHRRHHRAAHGGRRDDSASDGIRDARRRASSTPPRRPRPWPSCTP